MIANITRRIGIAAAIALAAAITACGGSDSSGKLGPATLTVWVNGRADETQTALGVTLRLAVPAMVTVGVLAFIAVWNDLLIAMLWLPSPGERTITAGLATLSGDRLVPVPEVMAASVIQAVPAIAVFTIFQRQMVRGMTLGVGR